MKLAATVAKHRSEIHAIVESHHATNAQIFGSVSRGEDTGSSDIDLLVEPTANTTLFDIGAIRHDLQKLLGVKIDVLTPAALPEKIRAEVIATARPI